MAKVGNLFDYFAIISKSLFSNNEKLIRFVRGS